jgi:hypothetical protein
VTNGFDTASGRLRLYQTGGGVLHVIAAFARVTLPDRLSPVR